MATESQIESADTQRYKSRGKDRKSRGGSTFVDPSIVPASLEACRIDEAKIPDMRRKIRQFAKDPDDQDMLMAMILGDPLD